MVMKIFQLISSSIKNSFKLFNNMLQGDKEDKLNKLKFMKQKIKQFRLNNEY